MVESSSAVFAIYFMWSAGPDRKRGFLGYRGLFSPTFINPIVNIENTDVCKSIDEYRKHGFIKVGEKNPRYPGNPRFRPGLVNWYVVP